MSEKTDLRRYSVVSRRSLSDRLEQVPMLEEYPKINTLWKRDERNKVVIGDYSLPEYEVLADVEWQWTEKVDGTNIRLGWTPASDFRSDLCIDLIRGRTDNAQIPPHLLNRLVQLHRDLPWSDVFGVEPDTQVTLYGEGYGAKIQKGGQYLPDRCDFVLFDVKIGTWWLQRADVEDVARKLGIDVVPQVGVMSIAEAVETVRNGFKSEWPNATPEGLVGRPPVNLFDHRGDRIITKIKARDLR